MKIYDAFISYRRSDGLAIAEELYRYLTARGLRVFFDLCEMVDGHYFTTQIETQLRSAPNYILVATDDVFRFREGEDWVRREIEVALEAYEQKPTERSVVVLTQSSVTFPKKETMEPKVRNITDVQRVVSDSGSDLADSFERVLNAITQVSRQNLWRAAHRWLENSKRPGGRFANLSIVESLLPNAEQAGGQCDIPVKVSAQPEQNGTQALFDAVAESEGHLFLIGQGGIGKTTALMHLMNAAYVDKSYSSDAQIPIFVELSFAPDVYDTLYEGGKSSFIRRSIYKQLRTDRMLRQVTEEEVSDIDEAFMLPYKVAVDPINDILSRTSPAPEYLLLLDGLNEVSTAFIERANSTVAKMIVEEINMLMSRCPNVRIVLTSRSDEATVSDQPITRFYLSGVDENTIQTHLEQNRVADAAKVMKNKSLVDTLKVPLFLTLYASLANQGEISTQGEIFRLFFNERRKNISVYTVQDRLDAVERNVYDTAGMNQRSRMTAQMQYFILDFLLPEIAWHMERKGLFYLRPNQIAQIIQPVLEDCSDTAVCGDFGKEVFTKFQQGSAADIHTQKTAEDILERLGPNISKCTEKIINCCTLALGILQSSGRRYGFIHQHIRDYFAAVKHINTLRLAVFLQEEGEEDLALACMNGVFREEPVNLSVRRFLGEALGEHQNKPIFRNGTYHSGVDDTQEDRTLLHRALDIYRGKFQGEGGYGQFTLLKTLTEVRGGLAGCDLSRLDLTGCHLNGTGLGVFGLAANVNGAKINDTDIFFNAHRDTVKTVDYSPDGNRMLSASIDGRICIWDAKNESQLATKAIKGRLSFAKFVGDGKRYITVSWVNTGKKLESDRDLYADAVCVWDTDTGEMLHGFYLRMWQAKMELCPDRRHLLVYDAGRLCVFETEELKQVFRIALPKENTIRTAGYLGCSEKLIVNYTQKAEDRFICYTDILSIADPAERKPFPNAQEREFMDIVCHGAKMCAVVRENRKLVLVQIDPHNGKTDRIADLPSKYANTEYRLHFNDSASLLAVIDGTRVWLYETRTFHLIKLFEQQYFYTRFSSVCFMDDENKVVLGTDRGDILVYDTNIFILQMRLNGAASGIYSFEYSPDGQYLATFSNEGGLRLWNMHTGTLVSSRSFSWGAGNKIHFAPDGKTVCLYTYGDSHILSVPNLEPVFFCPGKGVFSSDGKYFAVEHRYNSVVYDTENYHPVLTLPGAEVKLFLDSRVIVKNISATLTDNVWSTKYLSHSVVDLMSGAVLQVLNVNDEEIAAVATDGRHIAVGSVRGAIRILEFKSCEVVTQYQKTLREKERLISLEFSNDGKYLFENTGAITVQGDTVARETTSYELRFRKERYLGTMKLSPGNTVLVLRTRGLMKEERVAFHDITTLEGQFSADIAYYMGQVYAIDCNDTHFAIREQDNLLGIYAVEKCEDEKRIRAQRQWEISVEPGLDVLGVDLRRLHPDSRISEQHRKTLRYYGAIVD